MTDLALLAGPAIKPLAYNWLRVSQPKPFQALARRAESDTEAENGRIDFVGISMAGHLHRAVGLLW